MVNNTQMRNSDRYRLGIDIGGTFTDLSAVHNKSGKRIDLKTPTVPSNPAQGVANGISLLTEQGVNPEQIEYFVHGTTIALNALIQRSGVKAALFVTEGFRDILEKGRIKLPKPWDFYSHRPEPLVPRELVIPVRERMGYDEIRKELTEEEITRVLSVLSEQNVDSVAISLLHSYANPAHELKLKKAIEEELPHLFVSTSTEIWPQIREYERTSATVMNAYIQPVLSRYIDNLERTLDDQGLMVRPYIAKSNGGIMTTDVAKKMPIDTLLSGPASGVIGALEIGKNAGINNIITLDLGGTSADVTVIQNGEIGFSHEEQIEDFPLILPTVGISSIGAGGGSIAWVDEAGVLKVGPNSAGADPGPACYGKGGINPTLSDAFLISGYLNPASFVGNSRLDMLAAEKAISPLSKELGLNVYETAVSIIQVTLANMYTELSAVLERKGIDPRDYTLVAFGGAGAVVACQLAREININRVLIPASPGTLCAIGSLSADIMSDFIRSVNLNLDELSRDNVELPLEQLRKQANDWLNQEAPDVVKTELQWSADMHYVGQSYEVEVSLEENWLLEKDVKNIAEKFHDTHYQLFNHADPEAVVEIVNLRVRAVGNMLQLPKYEEEKAITNHPTPDGTRKMYIQGKIQEAKTFSREKLKPGVQLTGPIIIEQAGSTSVIPDGWIVEIDSNGNLILTQGAKK